MLSKRLKINIDKKRPAIATIIAVVVLAGTYVFVEFSYQAQLFSMRSSISKAEAEFMTSLGGAERTAPAVTHGVNIFDKVTCVDANCPQVEGNWQVPLSPDETSQYRERVAKAIKTTESWEVEVFTTKTADVKEVAPAGKEWYIVHIFVNE